MDDGSMRQVEYPHEMAHEWVDEVAHLGRGCLEGSVFQH